MLSCNKSGGHCHPGKPYGNFSESPAACQAAPLCKKVSVPPLELPKVDLDFCQVVGGKIHLRKNELQICCYGNHIGFNTTVGGITTCYQTCGWDGIFRDILLHQWSEEGGDSQTNEAVAHEINACPDDIERQGEVIWMKFQKVARTPAKISNGDEDYGQGGGIKF